MRGRDTWDTRPCSSIGITPAYAGKRHVCNAPCKGMGDHPRVCGEEQAPGRLCSDRRRITPAYAGKRLTVRDIMQTIGDHPRVCGEEARSVGRGVAHRGSPPRVRGKGCVIHFSCPPYGITPACAGKSHIPNTCVTTTWDHPRVCGEKCCVIHYVYHLYGITPACAGKRTRRAVWTPCGWDHPRVCGEKERTNRCACWTEGSPPRVRGKGQNCKILPRERGITPACAGKSLKLLLSAFRLQNHPRVCGEKTLIRLVRFAVRGSPPRVRGKVSEATRWARWTGITPACAGKSPASGPGCGKTGDYPRVCGEKRTAARLPGLRSGSPPRVRGKASGPPRSSGPGGITPACAGKSLRTRCADLTAGDHPRVCGEKAGMGVQHHKRRGSPPRVRGKVFYYPRQSRKKRITPACAGKSGDSSTAGSSG